MTDNKQPYGYTATGAAPYPPAPAGQQGFAPYPPGGQGFAAPGGAFPQTGFAGPGFGPQAGFPAQAGFAGYGGQPGFAGQPGYGADQGFSNQGYMAPPPHMGFHMPPSSDDGPKPYSNESGSSYGDIHGLDFSEKTIRMAFIRKVYGILGMQLLLTTGIIALFCLHQGVKTWLRGNPAFTVVSYAFALILMVSIVCCESVRRKSPHNLILLGLFTLTYGIVIGAIASMYNANSVVIAGGVTVVICLSLSIFSFQTKYDFTTMGGALFCCFMVLFCFGILSMFIRIPAMQMILAAAGALLFSVYLIYDTQLMMGGKHKMSISPEEYVFAALNIYTDVIMIFLYILQLFGSRD